jgi:hypothetical protein
MDYKAAGEKRILDLHELEELRTSAYENAKIYKERTQKWHNKRILKLFPRKICSRWSGPFEITKVFQNGAFEIKNKLNETFTVNGQRLKHYFCPNDSDYYSKLELHEIQSKT